MYKKLNYLSPDAQKIREEVFVSEQGFQNEFDEIDNYATHLVFYEKNTPVAVCRYYEDKEKNTYIVGRIAVLKAYRGNHFGQHILEVLEQNILAEGGEKISLSAQVRVQSFYKKSGYIAKGETYLDENCPHIFMEKIL
jgi:Predicted acyltransferase